MAEQLCGRGAGQSGRDTAVQQIAAVPPSAAQLHQIVAARNQVGVVLHRNHGVSSVHQQMDGLGQLSGILVVQSFGGLVQQVDLPALLVVGETVCQPDPLQFTGGKAP